jgi:hypothetical protein
MLMSRETPYIYVPENDKDDRYYDIAKGNINRCTGGILSFLGEGNFLFREVKFTTDSTAMFKYSAISSLKQSMVRSKNF